MLRKLELILNNIRIVQMKPPTRSSITKTSVLFNFLFVIFCVLLFLQFITKGAGQAVTYASHYKFVILLIT